MTVHLMQKDSIEDLYRELILDHARSPRHFGRLEGATHSAQGINPLCGDKLTLHLQVDEDGLIEASAFEGSGCAISVASASLLTDAVAGLPVEAAEKAVDVVTGRLTGHTRDTESPVEPALLERLGKLRALEGVRDFPSRVKCATLAWHALHAALSDARTPATTE